MCRGKYVVEIRVGTSGWHYKHWLGRFYPADLPASKMLDWYIERFDTVEINNSFYRLPPETALQSWKKAVPSNFIFAAKGSRFITHMKRLKDPELAVERYFSRIEILGRKLGPILFQLPPNWSANPERLAEFLDLLPPGHRYAFEFRDPSWHTEKVYCLLRRHNAAFCTFDLAGFLAPVQITANFAYIRLHGPGGKYQGSYPQSTLNDWAKKITSWDLKAVYVYFDNDDSGFAAKNAAELRDLLRD